MEEKNIQNMDADELIKLYDSSSQTLIRIEEELVRRQRIAGEALITTRNIPKSVSDLPEKCEAQDSRSYIKGR